MPDERIAASLRVIGGIVGLLEAHAGLAERGDETLTPHMLRDLAGRLREEHLQLWELLVSSVAGKTTGRDQP